MIMNQEFTAQLNKVRLGHKKMLLVENQVNGKEIAEARRILGFSNQKGAAVLLRALNSAIAAAGEKGIKPENLKLAEIRINKGSFLKRVKAASRGRMHRFNKPTTHVFVKVAEVVAPKAVSESEVK
jgi:large subunit ribosomal protein L22